jgi:uncharacterized protein (DUF779 family)
MFPIDEAPDRISVTPAAADLLRALAERTGTLTVLLSDGRLSVLPEGASAPHGSLRLGWLTDRVEVTADSAARTTWWRNRAVLDVAEATGGSARAITVDLRPLSEPELYAAVASGPLPRL